MEENIIIVKIERVAHESATEQINHLRRGRVERNFTTYLANKLKLIFEDGTITVDPFYNKHGDVAKRLNGTLIELDIAIHKKGVDHSNLVAIELETNNKPTRDDLWKIKGLTKELDGYGYKFGLFVVFGICEKAGEVIAMEWYKNGELL